MSETLSAQEAERLMDSIRGHLNEYAALFRYLESRSYSELEKITIAFLERNPHDERLLLRDGYYVLKSQFRHLFRPVVDEIFARRRQ